MKLNHSLLNKFEKTIDTINPDQGQIPIRILGYGEISLVFEILNDSFPIAYKRLPIFESEEQVKRHVKAYHNYHKILGRLGINIPPSDTIWFSSDKNDSFTLYCAQEKAPSESFGHKIIHHISVKEVKVLTYRILQEMLKIWDFNKKSEKFTLGLDGQISNWSVKDFDPHRKITSEVELFYIDTSTPFLRINGIEAMDAELFLKSAPSFLRFILKVMFLEEVVGRYYDFRLVTIDLLANFFKEKKPELIPALLKLINSFFVNEAADLNISSLTYDEVKSYYDEDKQIWVLFQNARRLDRWIQTKLLRKTYNFYLPDKIER